MKRLLSIILVITLTLTFFTSCGATDKALASTYLNLGEKYLTDLDYEQAIVYFNKVIEVEPKNERAYLGAAEAYVAMGDIDSAVSILEQGIEAVDDPTEIQAMLAELLGESQVEEQDEVIADEVSTNEDTTPEETVENEEAEEPVFVTTAIHYYHDGDIDAVHEYEYDSDGNEIKYVIYESDGSIISWCEYEYDSSGNQTRYVSYDSDGNVSYSSKYKHEYDSNGNEIKYVIYGSDGSISSWYEYEYDSRGNQSKQITYNSDGSVSSWSEYEYDLSGNEIKYTWYGSTGQVKYWCEYEYGSNGKVVKEIWYKSDESIEEYLSYEYDSYGNETKRTEYDSDGNVTWWREYKYEYDTHGNIMSRTRYSSSDYDYIWTIIAGIMMKVETSESNDDYCEYTYNSKGQIISKTKTTYDEDGSVYKIEYQSRIN